MVLATNSFFLCDTVLSLNNAFTESIKIAGKQITNKEINFKAFNEIVINLEEHMEKDNVSLDGIIKGFISFGAITLVINYAVRYVTIIFGIIISPLAIMFACSDVTKGIFKSWIRMMIINLCFQWIVLVLLIIPISFKEQSGDWFKIIIVGTIYLLYKMNQFIQEIFGKITDYNHSVDRKIF